MLVGDLSRVETDSYQTVLHQNRYPKAPQPSDVTNLSRLVQYVCAYDDVYGPTHSNFQVRRRHHDYRLNWLEEYLPHPCS